MSDSDSDSPGPEPRRSGVSWLLNEISYYGKVESDVYQFIY